MGDPAAGGREKGQALWAWPWVERIELSGGDRPGRRRPDKKAQQTGLYVSRNLEVGPCGQFTQRLRRDTGELAVFHDDEIRTGLDRGPPRSLVCTLHGGGA